jgi:GT2 family glycosyltransferase
MECLRSLLSQQVEGGFEVIVVDNASADGTVEAVRENFPAVKVIANANNRGFAAANNQALAVARGEYVLLLNPDTVVPAGALGALLAVADQHPQAGALAPKLLNTDGSLQLSCRRFPNPWAALFRNTILGRLFPKEPWTREYLMADWPHDEVREVDWASGAALLLRRAAIEQVGWLDEHFFWGSEDVDYCKRLWEAGWRVLYTPQPAIIHRIGGSTDRAVLPTIYRRHASWYRLYAKHFARHWASRLCMWGLIWARAWLLALSWVATDLWAKLKAAVRGWGRGR